MQELQGRVEARQTEFTCWLQLSAGSDRKGGERETVRQSGFLLLLGAQAEQWACKKDATLWLLSLRASGTCFHKAASNIFSSVLTTTLKSVLTTTLLQDTFFGTYAERNQSCPLPSFSERIKVIVGGDQTRFRGRTPLNSSTPSLKLRFQHLHVSS